MPHEHGRPKWNYDIVVVLSRLRRLEAWWQQRENCTRHTPRCAGGFEFLKTKVGAQLLTRGARGIELTAARRYVKLGFGGVHTDSNQRLMYTSAWASPQ
jgi:hypothetical protein